ncbi:unnamed protein product [Brassica oleracea]
MEQGTEKDKRGAILTDQPVEFYKRSGDRVGEYKRALETKLRDKLDLIKGLQDRINLISLELKDKKKNSTDYHITSRKRSTTEKTQPCLLNYACTQIRGD